MPFPGRLCATMQSWHHSRETVITWPLALVLMLFRLSTQKLAALIDMLRLIHTRQYLLGLILYSGLLLFLVLAVDISSDRDPVHPCPLLHPCTLLLHPSPHCLTKHLIDLSQENARARWKPPKHQSRLAQTLPLISWRRQDAEPSVSVPEDLLRRHRSLQGGRTPGKPPLVTRMSPLLLQSPDLLATQTVLRHPQPPDLLAPQEVAPLPVLNLTPPRPPIAVAPILDKLTLSVRTKLDIERKVGETHTRLRSLNCKRLSRQSFTLHPRRVRRRRKLSGYSQVRALTLTFPSIIVHHASALEG